MSRLNMFASACITILVALFITAGAAQAAALSSGSWKVVTSPNVASNNNVLNAVSAISTSDVWAVGYYYPSSGGGQTLTEHWNGTAWSVIASPNPGSSFNDLTGVSAITSTNVWAVGAIVTNGVEQTLTEHWNGTTWSVVASPNVAASSDGLFGVSAVSANNIWAVGFSFSSGKPENTLIEHWNGKKWSIVSSPSPGSAGNSLRGVVAITAKNVWAVGSFNNSGSFSQTLIEHWNGSTWSIVTSPNVGSNSNGLSGVTAVSANNVWAVGSYVNSSTSLGQTLIEQWNGTAWNVVSSPNPGSGMNYLTSVAAISAKHIWAVGSAFNSGTNTSQTLIEYWNGSTWSVVASPSPGSSYNILYGITRVPGTSHLWTVGYFVSGNNGLFQTLTEYKS